MARNPRSVRFPPDVEARVEQWAEKNKVAINAAIVELVRRGLSGSSSMSTHVDSMKTGDIDERMGDERG